MNYILTDIEAFEDGKSKIVLTVPAITDGFERYAHFVVPNTRVSEIRQYMFGYVKTDDLIRHNYEGLKIVCGDDELSLPKEECELLCIGQRDLLANVTMLGQQVRSYRHENIEGDSDYDDDYDYYCEFGDEEDEILGIDI